MDYRRQCWSCGKDTMKPVETWYQCTSCGATWVDLPSLSQTYIDIEPAPGGMDGTKKLRSVRRHASTLKRP